MTTDDDASSLNRDDNNLLVDTLVAAVRTAIGEMAGATVIAHSVQRPATTASPADIAVVVELQSAKLALLVFGFTEQTAAALAERILAGSKTELSRELTDDCLCEFANVVAGQAKTCLAETAYEFTFSLPKIVDVGTLQSPTDRTALAFDCETGPFNLELLRKSSD